MVGFSFVLILRLGEPIAYRNTEVDGAGSQLTSAEVRIKGDGVFYAPQSLATE